MKQAKFLWRNYDVLHGKTRRQILYTSYELIFRELGDTVSEEELKAMIDEFDLDGDGESRKLFL